MDLPRLSTEQFFSMHSSIERIEPQPLPGTVEAGGPFSIGHSVPDFCQHHYTVGAPSFAEKLDFDFSVSEQRVGEMVVRVGRSMPQDFWKKSSRPVDTMRRL